MRDDIQLIHTVSLNCAQATIRKITEHFLQSRLTVSEHIWVDKFVPSKYTLGRIRRQRFMP